VFKYSHVAHAAHPKLLLGDLKRIRCGFLRFNLCLQRARVSLESPQRVGDLFHCSQYRLPVIGIRLLQIRDRRTPLVTKLAAVEQRLKQSRADTPGARTRAEQASLVTDSVPIEPVRFSCGYRFAVAIPTAAVAWCN